MPLLCSFSIGLIMLSTVMMLIILTVSAVVVITGDGVVDDVEDGIRNDGAGAPKGAVHGITMHRGIERRLREGAIRGPRPIRWGEGNAVPQQ